ncbi:MAG: DUF59 domain-containing protein, partial [Rhodospirillaceae bacterium]|nr:DUF59 domain-containing protein [Rhodospirillaceae bacterium]
SEGGKDVVSLGMISGIVIRDGNVGFAIEVEPSEGAASEPLREACAADKTACAPGCPRCADRAVLSSLFWSRSVYGY